jgi:hypothetical protein
MALTDKSKQIEDPQATLYTISKTDNWYDRFEAGQHGVNNLAAGILVFPYARGGVSICLVKPKNRSCSKL